MSTLEQAFAEHDVEQYETDCFCTEMRTPCGLKFTHEPAYNTHSKKYDSIFFTFYRENGTIEILCVEDEENSFHIAYEQFTKKEFDTLQRPVEI